MKFHIYRSYEGDLFALSRKEKGRGPFASKMRCQDTRLYKTGQEYNVSHRFEAVVKYCKENGLPVTTRTLEWNSPPWLD